MKIQYVPAVTCRPDRILTSFAFCLFVYIFVCLFVCLFVVVVVFVCFLFLFVFIGGGLSSSVFFGGSGANWWE